MGKDKVAQSSKGSMVKAVFADETAEVLDQVPLAHNFGRGNHVAIRHTCEAIGQVIEGWGFKRVFGMIWAFLYLCPEPAAARDICKALNISAALASITLRDLVQWRVIRKLAVMGERSDYYAAEHDLWKLLKQVLEQRERPQVEQVQKKLKEALTALDRENRARPDLRSKRTCQFQRVRIEDLSSITSMATDLIDAISTDGRIDIAAIGAVLKPGHFYSQQLMAGVETLVRDATVL